MGEHPFGKFCGQKFPEEITSSDRYMWLRFFSDDNIEYGGFEGVFEYVEQKLSGKISNRKVSILLNWSVF